MQTLTKDNFKLGQASASFNNVLGTTAYKELYQLQIEQLNHDKKYHSDIHVLPVHQRMNHMALHFAKYTGRLIEADHLNNEELSRSIIVDIFVIALSSANILNLNLFKEIEKIVSSHQQNVGDSLSILEKLGFVHAMAVYTGKLAKACESLDHIEKYPFRESMNQNVLSIAILAIQASLSLNIQLTDALRERLSSIKEKNIFHPILSGS